MKLYFETADYLENNKPVFIIHDNDDTDVDNEYGKIEWTNSEGYCFYNTLEFKMISLEFMEQLVSFMKSLKPL